MEVEEMPSKDTMSAMAMRLLFRLQCIIKLENPGTSNKYTTHLFFQNDIAENFPGTVVSDGGYPLRHWLVPFSVALQHWPIPPVRGSLATLPIGHLRPYPPKTHKRVTCDPTSFYCAGHAKLDLVTCDPTHRY